MKALLVIVMLGLLVFAFAWERTATSILRGENESLRVDKVEAERFAAVNRELELRARTDATAGQGSHTELLRLRNEFRQLRPRQQEAATLRAANQRAAEEIKSGKFEPRRLADMEGAVPRGKWTFSGFATPEAAVQSLLAALASGDFEQVVRCVPPHNVEWMRKQMAQEPEKFRKEFMGGLDQFRKLTAFRITGVQVEEERAVVNIQLTADGAPVPLQMYLEENEWKLSH